MLKIAQQIARREDAYAICVGDNIGKRAKFALENLKMVDMSVDLPILRPLVGFDTFEAENMAKKLFNDTSYMKKQICILSAITDRYKDLWKLETIEEDSDLDLFIHNAVEKCEKIEF